MIYVTNAFSINMLIENTQLQFLQIDPVTVINWLCMEEFTSAVGHADTAMLIQNQLYAAGGPSTDMAIGPIPMNRISVQMGREDILLVAQYSGPRLPEGVHILPEGAKLTWWEVRAI